MKRNNVTGKGLEILEHIANLTVETEDPEARTGFLVARLIPPKERKKTKKTPRPKDGDKNLAFNQCSPEIQAGLRKTRAAEWRKWKSFNAGVILTKEEVSTLLDEGHKVYPMQWIETDLSLIHI